MGWHFSLYGLGCNWVACVPPLLPTGASHETAAYFHVDRCLYRYCNHGHLLYDIVKQCTSHLVAAAGQKQVQTAFTLNKWGFIAQKQGFPMKKALTGHFYCWAPRRFASSSETCASWICSSCCAGETIVGQPTRCNSVISAIALIHASSSFRQAM